MTSSRVACGFPAAFLLLLQSATTQAGVISTSGAVLSPGTIPSDLSQGALVSGTEISLFAESMSVTTTESFTVDVIDTGRFDQVVDLSPHQIGAGTYDAWLLHVGHLSGSGMPELQGSLTFDTDVVGIMVKSTRMGGTDDLFGSAGTNYATGASARGLELNQDDWLELSADRRTVTIQFEIRTFIDEIRIITMASSETPVPGPAGLAALAGIAGIRSSRRR